jgi:hypothetical protein
LITLDDLALCAWSQKSRFRIAVHAAGLGVPDQADSL